MQNAVPKSMEESITKTSLSGHNKSARVSVSFDAKTYSRIHEIARNHKVSAAWVVRDAVDRYLATSGPELDVSNG